MPQRPIILARSKKGRLLLQGSKCGHKWKTRSTKKFPPTHYCPKCAMSLVWTEPKSERDIN